MLSLEADVIPVLICHLIVAMNEMVVPEDEANYVDNHHRLLGHHALLNQVAVVALGKWQHTFNYFSVSSYISFLVLVSRDPSPGRTPNPPIECAPRPQAIRRQSSTTEEILIARGFRRQSTTEEMIRCRNFRRQSSQSDDVCQRFVFVLNFLNWQCISIFLSLYPSRYRGRRGKISNAFPLEIESVTNFHPLI